MVYELFECASYAIKRTFSAALSEPREPGETVWTKVVMNVTFAERNVSIIRLDFGSPSGPWGIGIYEVEAYRQW